MGILMLGAGLQSTLLGVRATIEAFPTAVTGIIMSCYYVGYLLGTRLAPRLLARVGPVRVFATLAALASVAVLAHGAWVSPAPWALMRFLSGICFAGIYVVAESWLNHRASSTNRGQLLAIYMLVLYVGLGSAQFLLVLSGPQSTEGFMLVSALISAAMVPIVASAQEASRPVAPQRVRFRDLYRNSPLGVVAVAFSGMISSIIFSMGPVYARLSGFGTRGVAAFMAVSIFAAVLTQYPVGRLSDRMDRRTVIASVCLLATFVAATIELLTPLPRALFLLLAALFSGAVLTLVFALGLARQRQARALANGGRQQRAPADQRYRGSFRPADHRRGHGRIRRAGLLRHTRHPHRGAHAVRSVAQGAPRPGTRRARRVRS